LHVRGHACAVAERSFRRLRIFVDPAIVAFLVVGGAWYLLGASHWGARFVDAHTIEVNGARFWLAGVNDVLGGTANLGTTLQGIAGGDATVLLAHEPDYADRVATFPVDLQLSGHSHGGQIRIPLLLNLYLPELGRKYVWGLYKIGGLTLYTNAGLGTVNLPIRLNCPPEITLLTLRRSAI